MLSPERVERVGLIDDGFTLAPGPKGTEVRFRLRQGLDVVVRQCPAIPELLPCKNQTLLLGRDPFLVLDLGFHVVNGVGRLSLAAEKKATN